MIATKRFFKPSRLLVYFSDGPLNKFIVVSVSDVLVKVFQTLFELSNSLQFALEDIYYLNSI